MASSARKRSNRKVQKVPATSGNNLHTVWTPTRVSKRAKDSESQPALCGRQLAELLQLTPEQTHALVLLAEWERESVLRFARSAIFASMNSSFDDMHGFAVGLYGYQHSRTGERAWARKFYRRAGILRDGKDWGK